MRSERPKIAVTTTTGSRAIRPSARSSRSTEKPSRLGIIRSSTMHEGSAVSTKRIASSPSRARRASRPSSLSAFTITSPSAASSSTTRMSGRFRRATAVPPGTARTDDGEWNEQASLQPDLLGELLRVLHHDVTAPDLDDVPSLEIPQHAVHRHSGCADECRQLVLRERELEPGAAVLLREVQQVLRDATRDVEEDQVLDAVRQPADGLCEGIEHHANRGRMALEEREEVVAREQRSPRVLERRRRCGPRTSVKQRELTEEVASAHDRDQRLLPELAGESDLHRAIEHDVEVRARIVLAEQHLATLEGAGARSLDEQLELGLRQLGE